MKTNVLKWQSPSLGSEAHANIYGHAGTPIILFNRDCEKLSSDHDLLSALNYQIEHGHNIICTLTKPDYDRVFDESLDAKARLVEYLRIERLVIDELIPRVGREYTDHFFIAAGVGNGGYLASNMVLKHPHSFGKLISVCGRYDMRPCFDGQISEDFYYNNPIEFLPHLHDEQILAEIRNIDLRFVSHHDDTNKEQMERISDFLDTKDVEHGRDIWDDGSELNDITFANMLLKHVP